MTIVTQFAAREVAGHASASRLPATDATVPIAQAIFATSLGWMGASWHEGLLLQLTFGHASPADVLPALQPLGRTVTTIGDDEPANAAAFETSQVEHAKDYATLIERLRCYADGQVVDLSTVRLDLSKLTAFQRQVTLACQQIGYGQTLSYGQLAAAAGQPRAARAVGSVMRRNRWPLIVPCHRVLASGGSIGGYSAAEGLLMKKRLLALEAAALRHAVNPSDEVL